MQDATYFLEKAEQCRRLAASFSLASDPAVAALEEMAVAFESKADLLIAGTVTIDPTIQVPPIEPEARDETPGAVG